jgi:hydrogenase maturation protease
VSAAGTDRTLVVGVGNPLRRDDGVGAAVVDALAGAAPEVTAPAVTLRIMHSLLPELAEDVARYTRVIFVDAADEPAPGTGVQVRTVGTGLGNPVRGHTYNPSDVLALAALLGTRLPRAWVVTVPAADLGLGRGLSRTTAGLVPDAVRAVRALLT